MSKLASNTERPDSAEMVAALRAHWPSVAAETVADGRAWYAAYGADIRAMGRDAGVSADCAAAVVAALSPRVHWRRNLAMAREMLAGRTPGGLGRSIRNARAILEGQSPESVLRGRKTAAFYRNLAGDLESVTVDVWAARAVGWPGDKFTGPQYVAIADAYRTVAAEVGLRPAEFQAVIWCHVRGRAI